MSKYKNRYLNNRDYRGQRLCGADFSGSFLQEADFRNAILTNANFTRTTLLETRFEGAVLTGTVLDPEAPVPRIQNKTILQAGLEIRGKEIWGWRTKTSFNGNAVYTPGNCYTAPVFSLCRKTPCHPGIYLASWGWLVSNHYLYERVRCYCLRSELVHAGNKWRCKRLWVVEDE